MRALLRTIIAFVLLVLTLGIGLTIYFDRPLSFAFFETTAPTVTPEGGIKAVGARPSTARLKVEDGGAGLDEVVVRIEQNGKVRDVAKHTLENNVYSKVLEVPLDGKALDLREGQATLHVVAFDRSFFSNGFQGSFPLKVDFVRPRVEVLTVQHNGTVGGALAVFYRVHGEDVVGSGVRDGTRTFPGYKAALLDPDFSAAPDVYFSLFPIATDFDPDRARFEVYVEDEAGNIGASSFYQKIQKKKFRKADMRLGREFFVRSVNNLLPQYLNRTNQPPLTTDAFEMNDDQLVTSFKRVNEEYRQLLARQLVELSATSEAHRFWGGVFEKPMPSAPTATFMEQRQYYLGEKEAGQSVHQGIDLAQTAQTVFRASNGGKVILADDLGIYGNAVMLDHGFGLTSLYGHLSAILVNKGEEVQKGQQLGRTGDTGLAGGDHLHFEIRLHAIPVSPFEWLDSHWIQDHVDGQIAYVKEQLKLKGAPQ